jgi:hypothetical protein
MTQLINVPTYWPLFMSDEKRRFYYTTADGTLEPMTSIFSYDAASKSMLYQDYNAAGEWQDTWYYYAKDGYGIAEWRDDYPQTNSWQKRIFGPIKKVVMSEPIGWGDRLPVGGIYQNNPKFDPLKSCPPQIGTGWQYVQIEAVLDYYTTRHGDTYYDVLQFFYQQKWGNKQTGARYWMAKGVGPVSVQWIAPNPQTGQPVETSRLDAIVTSENLIA